MKKRFLICLLLLCIIINISNVYVVNASVATTTSGICGNNLTWSLDSEGVLRISGSGDMTDWENETNSPFSQFSSTINKVIVEEGVTTIGDYAFIGSSLKEIVIYGNITTIGEYAFYCCNNLNNINLPSSVVSIGDYAFSSCATLTNITIPNSVTNIGRGAFSVCENLVNIELPDSLISIEDDLFSYCCSLTQISIPNKVIYIGNDAFRGCWRLNDLEMSNSIMSIGEYAFSYCTGLTEITIPNTVKSIGNHAFYDCSNLISIIMSDSVTDIDSGAFSVCEKLKNITLSNNLTSIEDNVFYCCESLTHIKIPNSVTHIGKGAFAYCTGLLSISIPKSVVEIETNAFNKCKYLTDVYYTGSEEWWDNILINTNNSSLTNATVHYNYETDESLDDLEEIPVSYVYMFNTTYTINVSEWKRIYADCSPSNATNQNLKWSSSNSRIATVNDAGIVTGKSEGTVTITAKSSNGKSASCTVRVLKQSHIEYDDFQYDFDNISASFGYSEGYKIPLNRYLQAGYSFPKAFVNYLNKTWNGNCFGMSMSSMLFYANCLHEENYRSVVNAPVQFDKPDSNDKSTVEGREEIKLRQMIELFHVTQGLETFNHRPFSAKEIANELDKGNPVALGMDGKRYSDGANGGHRVIIYGYSFENGCYEFDIYDCSKFVSNFFYTSKDNFAIGSHTYEFSPRDYFTIQDAKDVYETIRSNNSNDAISLFSLKNKKNYLYLIRTEDIELINSNGEKIVVNDCQLSSDVIDVQLVPNMCGEEQMYTIILPTDTYTIVGSGDKVITTSFADDYISVSVTAKQITPITISSDLKEISVDTVADEEYDITYTTYDNIFDEMTLSGTATGTVTSKLNDADILISGVNTLTASASVSDSVVSANSDSLSNCDEITVKCEEADSEATIQILSADVELTDKTSLPERLTVDTPTYDLASGTYTEGQVLNFTKDDDTIIYYTTDGSIPSTDNGIIYSLPIEINKSMTIKAISTKYGYLDSEIVELNYTLPEVDMPDANVESGEYDKVITVELSTGNYEDAIYYTLDGSSPLENGILYTVPINISEDTYLQAYTLRNGCISEISEYKYTVAPTYPFYFSNSLTNQDGEIITSDNIADVTKVKMTLSNLHTGDHTGVFLIAFYGADNRLIYVNYKTATIGEDVDEVEIDITEDVSSAYKVKAFAWKDLLSIQPICEALEENIITE